MEKPTGETRSSARAEAPLDYLRTRREPVRAGAVVGSVLLGLFWAALAGIALLALAAVTLIVFDHGRPGMTMAEGVVLWAISLACVAPPAVMGTLLAFRHLVREPIRLWRRERSPAGRLAAVRGAAAVRPDLPGRRVSGLDGRHRGNSPTAAIDPARFD